MQEHLRKIPGVPSRLIKWLPLEVPEPDLPLFEYEKEVIRRFYVRMPVSMIWERSVTYHAFFRQLTFQIRKKVTYSPRAALLEFVDDVLDGKLHLHGPDPMIIPVEYPNDNYDCFTINLRRPGPDGQYHR